MADPFEVRIKFTNHLQHLNASVTSAQKAAGYAIRHRDMDEDLHSCILEQVERNNMNNRANIMYFIEHLCDMAQREGHVELIRMVQRDILRIVDAVAPADGSGAANVKVVRRVLGGLRQKEMLQADTVEELEKFLKERETAQSQPNASPEGQSDAARFGMSAAVRPNAVARPDKRQIEQRIEEDRERHKRLRENIWAVKSDGNEEFEKIYDDASDLGEDDFGASIEDFAERKKAEVAVE